MTQFSDDLYLGAACTNIASGNNGGFGVGPMGRTYTYDIVPAALSATNIAASQSGTASTALTLTAGAGITTSVDALGRTVYSPDYPRNVRITSAGNDSAATFLVSGIDAYGQPMTERITGANAGIAQGAKAFAGIYSITPSANTAAAVTVGTGDKFGLPFRLYDANHVIGVKWASALAQDAGTIVAGDSTDPATATTGDVRGTYLPSSASNGSRRLTLTMFLSGIASGPTASRAGALGVTQA